MARALFDDAPALLADAPARPALRLATLPDRYVLVLDRVAPEDLEVSLDAGVLAVRSSRRDGHSAYAMSSRFLLPGPVAPGATPDVTTADGRVYVTIFKPGADTNAAPSSIPATPGDSP